MSSTDKQGSSLGSFPTSPPLYPHFNRPSGFWPLCQVVSGGRQRQILVTKRLCVRGELGTATYWPPALLAIAALLSHPAGQLNRGPWGPSSLLGLVLTASNCNNRLQTNGTSCRTGLYHCLTSTCFLWASHLHQIQPVHGQGDTLMSSTGCTSSLIDDAYQFRIRL